MKIITLTTLTLFAAMAHAEVSKVINNRQIVFDLVTYEASPETVAADLKEKCDRIIAAINSAAKNSAHSSDRNPVTAEVNSEWQCVVTNPFPFESGIR